MHPRMREDDMGCPYFTDHSGRLPESTRIVVLLCLTENS